MMQTYDFFWYAGALPDFVWQAATSLKLDVYEDTTTPENDVLFRFRNVIDNGYDEGGIVKRAGDFLYVSGTSSLDRGALREAGRLLDEAGWTMQGDMRRNAAGETLRVEILDDSPSFDRIINPYVANLRRLGVDAVYNRVDNAQATEREKNFDFDVAPRRYIMSSTPGLELRGMFHSSSAMVPDSSNLMGLANPAVDALIGKIEAARDREELIVAVKALDRTLRALHIWVPNWHNQNHNIAYMDVYRRPEQGLPPYAMGELDFWWHDADRAAELKAAGAF